MAATGRWVRPLAAGLILFVVYLAVAASAPRAIGVWQDDAIYVATAQSLAEGRGYRHVELPSEPLQTKYPPLYPVLLAGALLIGGSYADSQVLLLVPGALAGAALVVLSALYFRRVLGERPERALTIAALAAMSPALLGFVRYAMSDLVYGAFALASIYLVDSAPARDEDARRAALRWLAAGCLAAAAVLTRSIGLLLALALVAGVLLRRGVRPAIFAGAPVAVATAAWWGWRARAAALNGPLQGARLESPELDYAIWMPDSLGQTAHVVWQNAFRLAKTIGVDQLGVPDGLASQALEASWPAIGAVHGLAYTATALVVVGLVATTVVSGGRRWLVLHLYAVLYFGAVLAWPFTPARFLVPWTPFVLYLLFRGLAAFASSLGVGEARQGLALRAIAGLLLAVFAWGDRRVLASSESAYTMPDMAGTLDLSAQRAVESWIREELPQDARIASTAPAGIFLETGRRGHSQS